MALHIYKIKYDDYINIPSLNIDPFGMYILDNGMLFMGNKMYGLETFIHDQIASSNIWIINHPLKKFPSVDIIDSGGNLVVGDINYISDSQITITFSSDFSGKAFLN